MLCSSKIGLFLICSLNSNPFKILTFPSVSGAFTFCLSAFFLLPLLLLGQPGPSYEHNTGISSIQGGGAPCAATQSLFFSLPLQFFLLKGEM